MPETTLHALPLATLLAQAALAPDVCEPVEAPFSSYDEEQLRHLCQTETLSCDRPVQHLLITSRKGGFLRGNYCLLAGLLFESTATVPVASLEIRFSAYLDGPEIYLQSLCGPFTWCNDYAQLHAVSAAIAPASDFASEQFALEEEWLAEPAAPARPRSPFWPLFPVRSET